MKIGRGVRVEYKTWLAAVPKSENHNCCLEIGDGSAIGHFNHIYATKRISIGKSVLTADKVYISDNMHEFSDVSIPIINQHVRQISEVEIGDGTWLGENVCVIGAKVGKQSIVGANSVVTKDIPDYCVAVGAPARIVKRYSFDKKEWLPTNPDGSFKESGGISLKP
jgi:acetyltransferase-like isoleucine patch superfamily enzyme